MSGRQLEVLTVYAIAVYFNITLLTSFEASSLIGAIAFYTTTPLFMALHLYRVLTLLKSVAYQKRCIPWLDSDSTCNGDQSHFNILEKSINKSLKNFKENVYEDDNH